MTSTAEQILESTLGLEFSDEDAATIAALMDERSLADGDYLCEEGGADDTLHVILDGKLEVVKKTPADAVASLAVLREGDMAGELSFIDGETHTVGLRALADTRIASLTRSTFESIIDEHPQLVYRVMRAVARSAHRIVHRMNADFIELSNYIFKQHGRY